MIRFLLLLLWLPLAGYAQNFPAPLSDTVNDYAHLLPDNAQAQIAASLQEARDETGVHIVLVTIERQSDYGGSGRFADFATQWFNAWAIGDAARNDGILILVARSDREMRIALGRAYGPIWDGRAQRVIDTAMLPAFRTEDYALGLQDGVQSAIERLAQPFAAQETVTETSGFPEREKDNSYDPFSILVFLSAGALFIWRWFGTRIKSFYTGLKPCPNCHARGLKRDHEVIQQAGELTEGLRRSHLRCPNCGYDQPSDQTIPSLSAARAARKSSSSSSGFGGGSSSGGGASGKW